jgi:peroxiredoxin Q/BCP
MGIIRSTVLIGPDGKVIKHFPKVRVKGHVEAVLAALDEARSD